MRYLLVPFWSSNRTGLRVSGRDNIVVTKIPLKGINKADCPGLDDAYSCEEPISEFCVDVMCTRPVRPKYLYFHNLCGECFEVLREWDGKCCNGFRSPWMCNGQPVIISEENPEIILTVPGRYIFTTASGDAIDFDQVGIERDYIEPEFAELRLRQHSLCCCNQRVE